MSTSIRNHLPGTIEQIVSDKVVSEIVINTAAGPVTSIITTGSVKRMNLKRETPFSRQSKRPKCPSRRNHRRRIETEHYRILTAFARADSLILGKELEVKTEVSIEYCVV